MDPRAEACPTRVNLEIERMIETDITGQMAGRVGWSPSTNHDSMGIERPLC